MWGVFWVLDARGGAGVRAGDRTASPLPDARTSFRAFAPRELAKLDVECRGVLLTLEHSGILTPQTRELVLEKGIVEDLSNASFDHRDPHLFRVMVTLKEEKDREAARNHAGIFYVYGLVYDKLNEPQKAFAAYKKAVSLAPSFGSPVRQLSKMRT